MKKSVGERYETPGCRVSPSIGRRCVAHLHIVHTMKKTMRGSAFILRFENHMLNTSYFAEQQETIAFAYHQKQRALHVSHGGVG